MYAYIAMNWVVRGVASFTDGFLSNNCPFLSVRLLVNTVLSIFVGLVKANVEILESRDPGLKTCNSVKKYCSAGGKKLYFYYLHRSNCTPLTHSNPSENL